MELESCFAIGSRDGFRLPERSVLEILADCRLCVLRLVLKIRQLECPAILRQLHRLVSGIAGKGECG
jgi:hypothetical protein